MQNQVPPLPSGMMQTQVYGSSVAANSFDSLYQTVPMQYPVQQQQIAAPQSTFPQSIFPQSSQQQIVIPQSTSPQQQIVIPQATSPQPQQQQIVIPQSSQPQIIIPQQQTQTPQINIPQPQQQQQIVIPQATSPQQQIVIPQATSPQQQIVIPQATSPQSSQPQIIIPQQQAQTPQISIPQSQQQQQQPFQQITIPMPQQQPFSDVAAQDGYAVQQQQQQQDGMSGDFGYNTEDTGTFIISDDDMSMGDDGIVSVDDDDEDDAGTQTTAPQDDDEVPISSPYSPPDNNGVQPLDAAMPQVPPVENNDALVDGSYCPPVDNNASSPDPILQIPPIVSSYFQSPSDETPIAADSSTQQPVDDKVPIFAAAAAPISDLHSLSVGTDVSGVSQQSENDEIPITDNDASQQPVDDEVPISVDGVTQQPVDDNVPISVAPVVCDDVNAVQQMPPNDSGEPPISGISQDNDETPIATDASTQTDAADSETPIAVTADVASNPPATGCADDEMVLEMDDLDDLMTKAYNDKGSSPPAEAAKPKAEEKEEEEEEDPLADLHSLLSAAIDTPIPERRVEAKNVDVSVFEPKYEFDPDYNKKLFKPETLNSVLFPALIPTTADVGFTPIMPLPTLGMLSSDVLSSSSKAAPAVPKQQQQQQQPKPQIPPLQIQQPQLPQSQVPGEMPMTNEVNPSEETPIADKVSPCDEVSIAAAEVSAVNNDKMPMDSVLATVPRGSPEGENDEEPMSIPVKLKSPRETDVAASQSRLQEVKSNILKWGTGISTNKANAPIVLDNGTYYVKGGFGGELAPRTFVPSHVGRAGESLFVGKGLFLEGANYAPCPGMVPNGDPDWDVLEDIWDYIITDELKTAPEDHPFLLTEVQSDSSAHMFEVLFEKLGCHSVCVLNSEALALQSLNKPTGIVVDCGNQIQVVPILNGSLVESSIVKSSAGISQIDEWFRSLLIARGFSYRGHTQDADIRRIKEAACYVAQDYAAELSRDIAPMTFPCRATSVLSGNITLRKERFMGPEILFNSSVMGPAAMGVTVQDAVLSSVAGLSDDEKKLMLENIVLAGGSTCFPGFEARLRKEIVSRAAERAISLDGINVNIIAQDNRAYVSWYGGSMFSSLPNFSDLCLTYDQFYGV